VRVLLIHQNFPAQFRHLCPALLAAGHEVAAIGNRNDVPPMSGLVYLQASGPPAEALRESSAEQRCLRQFAQGRKVSRQLQVLARRSWHPDVVVAHPFWGDLLFLDDVFPDVPLVALMEMDLLGVRSFDGSRRAAGHSLLQWTTLQASRRMAVGLTATQFQLSTFPTWLQSRIAVIHEGIDLQRCCPAPVSRLQLPDGTVLRGGEPIVTFSCRCLEPLRGFDTLMRALPELLERHPRVRIVICGEERGGYGADPGHGSSWKERLLAEIGPRIDSRRVLFPGLLPHASLMELFRLSWAHVYFTAPFVLSWSLLEAMACGALVVGSSTSPVLEVIEPEREGLLVPFDDPVTLTSTLLEVLEQPARFAHLRLGARRRIAHHYDHRDCLTRQLKLIGAVARNEDPFILPSGDDDG
jgi:glycosyltransferase involved in cell wall biosynthesis